MEKSPAIMRNQHPTGGCRPFEEFRILYPFELRFDRGREVQRWFPLPNSLHDIEVKIGVRLETDTQELESLILALAR